MERHIDKEFSKGSRFQGELIQENLKIQNEGGEILLQWTNER